MLPNHWAQSQQFYQRQTLGTISTVLSMLNHWARSQRLSMPNTGHDPDCSINPTGMILETISPKHWTWSQLFYLCQTTGQDLRDYQCQTLDTISTVLSMPNTGHDLNCSINTKPLGTISETINAKHWAWSQPFYQCQTTGYDLRDFQCQTLGMISNILSMPNHWARSHKPVH